MKAELRWIDKKIFSVGLFDFTLPVVLIGTGKPPFVSITALLHGDETIGLFALHKFLREYVPKFQFNGTLQLIPVANPLGALTQTRASLLDMLDMNRGGIGRPDGQITEQTAYTLYNLVKDSDLVINFHEFEADSALVCVYTNSGPKSIRGKILKGILAFNPDIVWSIPRPDKTDYEPILSFDAKVATLGTPIFSIEFSRGDLVSQEMLDTCLSNLVNVLLELGVIDSQGVTKNQTQSPVAVKRKAIYTPTMGIWESEIELMALVEEGQKIGTLSSLPHFEEIPFYSPEQGQVIQLRPSEVVKANSILFAVGISDTELQLQLNELM